MNPDDDDDSLPEYQSHSTPGWEPQELSEYEIWLMNYLASLMADDRVFLFTGDNPQQQDEYSHDLLDYLQDMDDLVQGDEQPWALEQIMAAYRKHG